jgi:ectoine hydroxylase-related dioxygenase (phytanoyl-CoA dioxygenase family)
MTPVPQTSNSKGRPIVDADSTTGYDIAALKAIYEKDGVVKVPALVSQAWVARLTAAIAEFRKRDPGDVRSKYFGHGPGRSTVRWMWREVEELLQFASESGVAPVIGGIVGASFLRFWYDNTFIHESGYEEITAEAGYEREFLAGTPWHHDVVAFPFAGEQDPGLWVALTPVSEDTAPLTCIKGSHRTGVLYRPAVYFDQHAPVAEGFRDTPDWDAAIAAGEWEKVWFPMEPGDALIIHPNTVHGAPPAKNGAATRIGFSSRWAGDDIRWWDQPYALKFLGIDFADVEAGTAPDGEFFPMVWKAEPSA